jgi:hypothetical protein
MHVYDDDLMMAVCNVCCDRRCIGADTTSRLCQACCVILSWLIQSVAAGACVLRAGLCSGEGGPTGCKIRQRWPPVLVAGGEHHQYEGWKAGRPIQYGCLLRLRVHGAYVCAGLLKRSWVCWPHLWKQCCGLCLGLAALCCASL